MPTTIPTARAISAHEAAGERLFWKIDYFDRSMARSSRDRADPSITARVLTVMLAAEY